MGITIDQMTQIDQIQIVDSNGNLATIKAASGAALTTDTAIVVGLSPNSPLPAGTNAIGSITNTTFASTQSGTWTIQPGNTANTTPWLMTVSTALPAGANNIGSVNQGTSPWVVQDNASNTSAASAVARGLQVMGIFNTTPTVLTTGQAGFLQLDANENLLVNLKTAIPAGANTIGAVTQASGPWTQNLTQVGGAALALGQATMTGSIPVAIASNQSAIPVTQSGTWTVQPGNTANTTPWLVTVSTALPAGANNIGSVNQGTSPWVVQDNASNTSAASAVARGLQVMGIFNTTPTVLTTGQAGFLQLDANENLLVNLKTALPAGTNIIGKVELYDSVGNGITSASNGAAGQQLLNVQTPNTTTTAVALGALNATVSISMAGLASCGFQVAAGTLIGTVTPQCSIDGGTTWTNVAFLEPGTETVVLTYSFASANPATVLSILPVGGATNCRVIVSAYTSGTAQAMLTASEISISTGSTASVATDLNGNGTLTAINQTVVAVLHGCAAMVWDIQGTFVGTIQFQATVNGGIDWFNIQGIYAPYNTVSGIWSANAQVNISCGGYQQVRALCTAYTSGTITLYWDASAGSNFTWSYVYNEAPTNLQTLDNAYETSGSYPDPYNVTSYTPAPLNQDVFGNLQVRGPAISDEGSFRDDFTGTSLATTLSGTIDFTNGSAVINGTGGTAFNTQVGVGQYLKINTDPEADYTQVDSVLNSSSLNLVGPYPGTTNTGATGVVSNWLTTTGSGSLTVASSLLSIASGTTNGNTTAITRDIDYLPLSMTAYASISQRIANQTAILGFVDDSLNNAAVVQFTGTNNTQVNFITAFSSQATDIQTVTVTLPNGAVTSSINEYVIDLSASQATLSINGIIVAVNTQHLPGPYEDLQARASITNSATVTTTTLAIDNIYFENIDRLQVTNDFSGEPLPVFGNVNSGQPDNNSAPVKVGAVAVTNIAGLPSVASGNRVDNQADLNGRLYVTNAPQDGAKATYSATSAIGFASATTATDIFTITGSATKTIRVIRIGFSAQETTAGVANVLLVKRSAANTGGTSAAATAVPNDSNDAAATATVLSYTANPSALGAAVGTVRAARMFIPTSGTDVSDFVNEFEFGNLPGKAIVLRGTAQVLAINLNATTVTGGTWTCYVEWTEE